MIVMKFGGSSVESARAIQRVASIVSSQRDRHPVVVVSAMGKTTDRLLAMAQFRASGKTSAARREFERLREFHLGETANLLTGERARSTNRAISLCFEELEAILGKIAESGVLTPAFSDSTLSFGERLSSLVAAAGFNQAGIDAVHLDSRTAIITDDRHTCAALLPVETNALLRRKISREHVTVMGGFIGATESGIATTLGRGGSDYTAAIAGAAIGADEIQIWTDVDGMLTCDPRLVPEAHCLRSISYSEAAEMAKCGAKVLHPATVLPAVKQRIPVVIRNSRNPAAAGTRIVPDSLAADGAVLSIACRKDVTLLHVRPRNTPVTSEFGKAVWDVLGRANVVCDLISPAVHKFSLAVNSSSVTTALRDDLSAIADLTVDECRAMITMVGRNPSHGKNIARASKRLEQVAGGAVMTCCTDSRLAFVVSGKSLETAAAELHREFFSTPDLAYFIAGRQVTTTSRGSAGDVRESLAALNYQSV